MQIFNCFWLKPPGMLQPEEDDAKICDDWETPTELVWVGDRWIATRTVENNEFNWMRKDILAKREEWIPQEGGERAHYKLQYLLPEGWINQDELQAAQAAFFRLI